MARKWQRDINYHILSDQRHWTENHAIDPEASDPSTGVHVQWRRNLNNNVLMNLFAPDSADTDPAKPTKLNFENYYNGEIKNVLARFRDRMDTLPWDKDSENPREQSKFMARNLKKAKKILDNIVTDHGGALDTTMMRVLYTKSFYGHARKATLLAVLEELDHFKDTLKWVCLPFLNLPRTNDDIVNEDGIRIAFRPTEQELDFHINGYTGDPTSGPELPDGSQVGNMLDLSKLDFEEFLFFKATTKADAEKHKRAREYAAEWGIFDPLDVVARQKVRDGIATEAEVIKMAGVLSSGNGYRCQINPITGARECVPSNQSSFCVANGSTICP